MSDMQRPILLTLSDETLFGFDHANVRCQMPHGQCLIIPSHLEMIPRCSEQSNVEKSLTPDFAHQVKKFVDVQVVICVSLHHSRKLVHL